jgi:hypothetical protein
MQTDYEIFKKMRTPSSVLNRIRSTDLRTESFARDLGDKKNQFFALLNAGPRLDRTKIPDKNTFKKFIEDRTGYLYKNFPPGWPYRVHLEYVSYINKLRNIVSLPPYSKPQKTPEQIKIEELGGANYRIMVEYTKSIGRNFEKDFSLVIRKAMSSRPFKGNVDSLADLKKSIDYDTNYLFNNFPPNWPKDMYPGWVEFLNKQRALSSLPPFIVPKLKVEESESGESEAGESEAGESESGGSEASESVEEFTEFDYFGRRKRGFSATFIIISILILILLLGGAYMLYFNKPKNTSFGRRSGFGRRR